VVQNTASTLALKNVTAQKHAGKSEVWQISRQGRRVEGATLGEASSGEAKEGEDYVRSAKSGHVTKKFGVV